MYWPILAASNLVAQLVGRLVAPLVAHILEHRQLGTLIVLRLCHHYIGQSVMAWIALSRKCCTAVYIFYTGLYRNTGMGCFSRFDMQKFDKNVIYDVF